MVNAVALSTQTPTEMAAIVAIGALAACAQANYSVQVTPDWSENLSVYALAVAASGERKSAVFSLLTSQIYREECEYNRAHAVEIAKSEAGFGILERRVEALKKKLSDPKPKDDLAALRNTLQSTIEELAAFVKVARRVILADDITVERTIDLMDGNGGVLAIASAEGGFFGNLRRYDNTSIDAFLKAYSGDFLKVDRVSRDANNIEKPRLSLILTVQPAVLHALMSDEEFLNRGLCARFLYAVCGSNVGQRIVNPPSVPADVRTRYDALITELLSRADKGVLTLSQGARDALLEYAQRTESELAEGERFEDMRDWGNKQTGRMMRIAGILHAVERDAPVFEPIGADTIKCACAIAECLSVHAVDVYQQNAAETTEVSDARYLWRRINSLNSLKFAKSELTRKVQNKKGFNLDDSLSLLVERGYIRIDAQKGERGRPTETIFVNSDA
jgi:DNA-binding XRE family transcriptional regulator